MKSKKTKQIEHIILHPRENPNLYGHNDVITTMFSAYKNGNMPGAWLISGPRGIGKATLAYRFARFMLYNGGKKSDGFFAPEASSPTLDIPVNSPTFSKVNNGSHPDLLVLEAGAEDSKSNSDDILVDDARKIGSFLHLTSAETPYRIVIIDSIDNMNSNAANSILKLLEEPPSDAIFILISHAPGKLLPTIRSRCRQIKMRSLAEETSLKILSTLAPDISTDIASKLLELASGSPGTAYDIYINNGEDIYAKLLEILAQLPKLNIVAIQKLGDSISGKPNENNWRITRMLLNKIIIDTTKQIATGAQNQKMFSTAEFNADKLVQTWQEINLLLEDADNLHLDRKAILMKVFFLLSGK